MTPSEFWTMTPHAFGLWTEGWSQRVQMDGERGMALAWHGAAFQRAKRLPQLKQVLAPPPDPDETMEDRLFAALSGLSEKRAANG